MSQLTSENLRELSGESRAEQEEALWRKMQTISELLGQVDAALETASSAPPNTGQSRPPPTGASTRTTSQRGATATSQTAACGGGGASLRGRQFGDAPQLAVIHDDAPPSTAGSERVQMVTYTGSQTLQISSRRKIGDARAASSSIGGCFGGEPGWS